MVTDEQVRRFMKQVQKGKSLSLAAAKAAMSENTSRAHQSWKKPRPSDHSLYRSEESAGQFV